MPPVASKLARLAALALTASCLQVAGASAATTTNHLDPGVEWSGDMAGGNLSQWSITQGCPGSVSMVNSPAPDGGHAVAMNVNDNDTESNCPGTVFTHNPADGILSPALFHNGDDDYIGFSTYFPNNFPIIPSWFQFAEIYGPPYGGSPPLGFDVEHDRLGLWRNEAHDYDNPWSVPVTRGAWLDMVVHVKFSSDPSVGFVEIWLNGVAQRFTNGSTRLYMATLVPGVNWAGGNSTDDLDLDQYRDGTHPLGPVTIYHAAAAIGSSYAAVAPSLHLGVATTTTSAIATTTPARTGKPKRSVVAYAAARSAAARRAAARRRARARQLARLRARRHHHLPRHHRRKPRSSQDSFNWWTWWRRYVALF